ncbi:MAG TPA: DoxX family protein, partial [Solirubrobacteraceae bacterium]|nr:DoxX family protein [Solirubrobacteraceae bacterium]
GMGLGIAALRLVVCGLFVGHGLQKLKGWFGGHGPERTGEMFDGLGLRPGRHHATAAGVAETAGGALLATGLLTPVAGSVLTGTMATAIRKVHAPKGVWSTQGGYECNLTLIAAIFAVVDTGPRRLSLDSALGIEGSGLAVALAQLAAGLAGSAAVIALGERAPEPEPQPQPAPAAEAEPYRPRFVERADAARAEHDGEPANR